MSAATRSSMVATVLVAISSLGIAFAQVSPSSIGAIEQAKVVASDAAVSDNFGHSVAMSGDTLIVGAPYDDNSPADNAGSAYVFVRSGSSWIEQAKLTASDASTVGKFGYSVALSGDTAVVGAPAGQGAGSAFVFFYNGTAWTKQAKLSASDAMSNDAFGVSVAVSGDTVMVGANAHDYWPWTDEGSTYVFVRTGTSWVQQARLLATPFEGSMNFGSSVALLGDTAVIGASGYNTPFGAGAGSAFVFVRSGSTWTQHAKLVASDAAQYDGFGRGVGIWGDTVIVGAPGDDLAGISNAGSVYAFKHTGSSWLQVAKLTASDAAVNDAFGYSLAIVEGTVVVAAPDVDELWGNAGAAYVFQNVAADWIQTDKLVGSDTAARDLFGKAISVSGDTVVVGAPFNDHIGGFGEGSAYVFALAENPWMDLGFGLNGAVGIPALVGTGTLAAGTSGSLTLSNAAPSALALLFVSLSNIPSPFKCGTLIPVPVLTTFTLATSPAGGILLGWPSWPTGLSGLSLYFQYAIQDAAANCGASLSNALRADVP